jgi:hypothetical protein
MSMYAVPVLDVRNWFTIDEAELTNGSVKMYAKVAIARVCFAVENATGVYLPSIVLKSVSSIRTTPS